MSATTTPGPAATRSRPAELAQGTLPPHIAPVLLAGSVVLVGALLLALGRFSLPLLAVTVLLVYTTTITVASARVEGGRKAKDRFVTAVVYTCFGLAMVPLVSVLWTVVTNGVQRMSLDFLTVSMNGVTPTMDAGGVYHAIVGTLMVTGMAAVISVPIGLLTAIYLVEYGGNSRLAKAIVFFVDVMTGIPSIVAGLFVVALWMTLFGPGQGSGAAGAVALSVLMIPVVVRSCEEMLRLVPHELREAAYALGVPKWLTILKVVLPTAASGITTGIMLALARVIGETAPLILTAGSSAVRINWNLFDGQMMTLPVFIYSQVRMGDAINYERAWAAALTLILVVMLLFLAARLVGRLFAPKQAR
ncbi:phosphate ABC transporter permease PstA [Lipingzhangella sp. LS1_29]|uniref:Phosphate transport system permease protein PstA n=1 Tax=Lipingzhangella rawalii TaxID=2055835 RepID=A0ABU2HA52_9ACTN|nr:phosphate ABC transporter permease PstA [Lipingzhangella rawalii]MDS1271892.1 phosphate ABC transporter permease PstA [Lipingzhangella rawalii]